MPNRNIRAISNDDMHLRILLGFLTSILLRLGSLSQRKPKRAAERSEVKNMPVHSFL